jgi:hypothetical protein
VHPTPHPSDESAVSDPRGDDLAARAGASWRALARTGWPLVLACAISCSGIEGDVDLAPLVRTANHPDGDLRDSDVMGPIVPYVEDRDTEFYGVRPLFTVEDRPFDESLAGREKVISFIAPFGKYHSNPRTTQFRFSPLLWSTSTSTAKGVEDYDFVLFPILWFGSTTVPEDVRGVGERDDSYFAAFPLIGQINSFLAYDRIQFVGWPLFQRLYKRVFEQEGEEAFTSIALLIGWTTGWPRGGSWHVIPFYSQSKWVYPPYQAPSYPEGADPSQPLPRYDKRMYLPPFIHVWDDDLDRGAGKETKLLAVWPFFKHEWSYDHEFWTILWPFFRVNKEWPYLRDAHQAKMGTALSATEAQTDERTNVLYDVFTQAVYRYVRTEEYWRQRILLFLWAEYHSLPEERRNTRLDSIAFFQPIGFWKRDAWEDEGDGHRYHDRSYYVLVPFFHSLYRYWLDEEWNETGRVDRFVKLWPLVSYENNADGSANVHVFTLLPLRVERFVKDFNDAWLPFVNLYGYERTSDAEGGRVLHTALFRLVKWYRDANEDSLSVPILYTGRTLRSESGTQYTRRVLFGLFGLEGEDAPDGTAISKTLRLFWIPIPLS